MNGDAVDPEWLRELMFLQPNRYRELTRINAAKLERRRQFAAAIQRSTAGEIQKINKAMLYAHVDYIVHNCGGPLGSDFLEDEWWDTLGSSVSFGPG